MIHTKEKIKERAEEIQTILDEPYKDGNIEEATQRGNIMVCLMAETGKLLADAKYHQDQALSNSILKRLDIKLSPSTLNKLVEAECKEENYLVNWMERINRSCTHDLDWCRTLVSKAKEEMRFQSFMPG